MAAATWKARDRGPDLGSRWANAQVRWLPSRAVERPEEPVWLVRAVLYLFLVGFAAFLATEFLQVVRSWS